ncbi:hypothetical protein SAY87_003883 [Trapa incisa]|uniref:Uncharacterized protein n=1 Tax=Trapa incisa TaxID=236973 RepID=A0AAN7JMZ7_9MYRT|nr:hypothetical protein SAY87_003883 [Trapa incisa]
MNGLTIAKMVVPLLALNILIGDFSTVSGLTNPSGVEKAVEKEPWAAAGWFGAIYARKIVGVGQPATKSRSLRAYTSPSPPSPVTSQRTSMGGAFSPPPLVY